MTPPAAIACRKGSTLVRACIRKAREWTSSKKGAPTHGVSAPRRRVESLPSAGLASCATIPSGW
eukprot:scaffold16586_cov33-Tisochrysis_lutea.AAC.3